MAKKSRVRDYGHHIQFYEKTSVFDEELSMYRHEYCPIFKRWARVKIIFREQLESVISGGNTLRDRIELTLRHCDDIDGTMKFEYRGQMYNISIIGDKTGLRKEISLLGESVMDGGE